MNKVIGYADFDLTFHRKTKNTCFSTVGNFATKAMNETVGSDICITNAGSVRSNIFAGNVTVSNIYTALPFDNNIIIIKMKGKDIQQMLNNMCSYYKRGPWFQCSGVSCTYHLNSKVAKNIKIGNKMLDAEKIYSVSTSSFVAEGNLNGDILFKNAIGTTDTGILMRDATITYVKKLKTLGNYKSNGITIVK